MKFHIFHDWSEWKVTNRGDVNVPSRLRPGHLRKVAEVTVQERVCSICKLRETKSDRVDLI